jgi:cytochrome c-type biogenesis protein CcmH/NrfG
MPDVTELLVLAGVAGACTALVGVPLARLRSHGSERSAPEGNDDLATLDVRHRIALEAVRDVEADRRAGSLDEAGYAALREEAEIQAARTLAALETEQKSAGARTRAPSVHPRARRVAVGAGVVLLALLGVGSFLPAPWTLANQTVVNEQLAASERAEANRQALIHRLLTELSVHPNDAPRLVALARAYLDSGTDLDRQRAAIVLLEALKVDPKSQDAYRLLITAYITSGDYTDAAAATDAFAKVAPNSADVAFFRGLIAYQGSGDRSGAVRWFDRFLQLAPSDPRAAMVRSLRAEAAGQLPGSSPAAASPAASSP